MATNGWRDCAHYAMEGQVQPLLCKYVQDTQNYRTGGSLLLLFLFHTFATGFRRLRKETVWVQSERGRKIAVRRGQSQAFHPRVSKHTESGPTGCGPPSRSVSFSLQSRRRKMKRLTSIKA